jgi:hypothetical protein
MGSARPVVTKVACLGQVLTINFDFQVKFDLLNDLNFGQLRSRQGCQLSLLPAVRNTDDFVIASTNVFRKNHVRARCCSCSPLLCHLFDTRCHFKGISIQVDWAHALSLLRYVVLGRRHYQEVVGSIIQEILLTIDLK